MHGRQGKYRPLCQYLEQLPAAQQSVRLSFPEIEALVGEPLPATANWAGYWSSGGVARQNWRRSGWQAKIYRPAAVLFSRLAETP